MSVLGCIAHQHCLNRYDFNLCLKTVRLREGSLKSSGRLFQRAGPEVAKLRGPIVSFLFSAQEGHLAPSSEDGRGLEQLISSRLSGRLFQRAGPEVAKLRGPIVFVFVLGTRRSPRAVERRRERAGTVDFRTSISMRYAGAVPWRHL